LAKLTRFSQCVNLGVLIDGQLIMAYLVASLCQSCIFQLQQLRLVRPFRNATTLVHAFLSSRLNFCNSLLYRISDNLLKNFRLLRT